MADEWQFQINDGPWHNIGEGYSYSAVVPYTSSAVKVTHRRKPKHTPQEILAKITEVFGAYQVGGATLSDYGLATLQAILRGDF